MKSTNTDNKIANQVSNILIDLGCIILRPNRPFKYNTGIISPVYTDNRVILSSVSNRKKIADLLIQKVKQIGIPDVIAGTATAGIAYAAFIAQRLNLPMIYVRPTPKVYGKENQVEGKLKRGQTVIVIDDLISTGRSSLEVVRAIRKSGGIVQDILAITTYGLKIASNNFEKNKIKITTLTDLNRSCLIAVKKGFLKPDQVNTIKNWAKDPKNWGKKMGYE
ncbi:orotate phosphoribosyltransferase [Candidatus Curtissbacteria bacterium RIFCSPLOWO2_01_FULL_38_11b]|uniref:Orotate phosphoribosyltransferase n=1 Tax=Candidatus Curtissbacteria bacterium RIFCSPLOWO2_01_FULL_38_11b TaxID=1797725 RepID=A0A1F5H1U6_9BACT|nr:MAG: orotate phosphoribosyltransferase [Candidatus Curtissbacteria bacterium RIFCSPLOWO2_01_FULL_38_11b]